MKNFTNIKGFHKFLNEEEETAVDKKLSAEEIEKVKKYLQTGKNGETQYFWDYRDELSDEQAGKIIDGHLNDVENEIQDMNLDTEWDLENDVIKNAMEACGLEYKDYDKNYLRDEFLDFISVDMDMKTLLKRKEMPVRLTMYSNYDVINSHYFEAIEGGGYEYPESYFGATIDALNLNPSKVKKLLEEHNIKTSGKWPNLKDRDGKEYVSYEDFWQEEENRSCPACQLVFLAKLDLADFESLEMDKDGVQHLKNITIPAGNYCGFYSSMQGGGSTLEMKLKRGFTVDLTKHGATKYDSYGIEAESKDNGYTIQDTYGTDSKMFGKNAKIEG